MKLMIVESPNKVKKIKSILGAGWDVAASVGHIRDLPEKELGLAMPGYRPMYELNERGADVVKGLRARAARAEAVYLATDPDREGEAIAWHLAETLKLKSARRVSFDAITPEVILRAVERPRAVDAHLVHAQEARRVLDRLVGYQVSPLLSRQTARRGLSAGRVQSPAVRLVVDREREILAFVEVRHFGAELSFEGNSWRAQWETAPFLVKSSPDSSTNQEQKYILDEALAARAAACRDLRVLASSNRIARQAPPPPFTTSTMLQAASVQLRWKPDFTAGVAQRLFEAGLITYHRTDSQNFSAEALKEVRAYAGERGLPLPAAARSWRARGNAQEAHEAIRPTHFRSEQAGEDAPQGQLYRLIWLRAVASQLADAEWSVNTTRLESKDGGARFLFKAEGRVLVAGGWKVLTAKDDAEEETEEDGDGGRVPVLAVGVAVRAESGRVLNKKTQPPPRYTQASLIKKLESMGIGRPSTYPAILKNVQTRGYLEDVARFLRPTELGFVVVDALLTRFSFVEYAFTRALEEQLDDIAEGKRAYLAVVSAADEQLQRELQALGGAPRAGTFAHEGSAARRRSPSEGASENRSRTPAGVAHTPGRLPDALARLATMAPARPLSYERTMAPQIDGCGLPLEQPPSRSNAPSEFPVPGHAAKRTSAGKAAGAEAQGSKIKPAAAGPKKSRQKKAVAKAQTARAANDGTQAGAAAAKARTQAGVSSLNIGPRAGDTANMRGRAGETAVHAGREAAPPCPVCKAGFVRLPREDARAYGCTQFAASGCRFTIWRTLAGRELDPKEIRQLCREGRTGLLSGFVSKAGRPFAAALVLTSEGKVEFSFPSRD